MASTPRVTLDDSYILGVTCAICGADALAVNHVPNLPDYVNCKECNSAFLVEEGGDRVFYGQVASGYEETERFALKQWAWIEAVETRAREERPRPEGESELPDPETIEESFSTETPAEAQTAEEWISSEIPAETMENAGEVLEESPVPDLHEMEAPVPELTADEEPTGTSPFEAEQQPTPVPELTPDEDDGLADFFDALTDDTGEVTPIVEPDEFLQEPAAVASEGPDLAEFDADIERLMATELEDDDGPDLPPPPWTDETVEESPLSEPVEEAPMEAPEAPENTGQTWESFFEAEESLEDEAVPVVDAKDETYESMPAWQSLDEGTPLTQDEEQSESLDWAMETPNEAEDQSEAWGALERVGSGPSEEGTPEMPAWAVPDDDAPGELSTGPDELSWGTEPAPEREGEWQEIPGMFSEETADDDDAFLNDLRRSAAVPLESEPVADQPLEDDEQVPWDMDSEDIASRMEAIAEPYAEDDSVPAGWEMTAAAAAPSPFEADPVPEPVPAAPLDIEDGVYIPPPGDPPQGQRHRVVIRGDKVIFPRGECAHCGRSPERGKLAVAGTLPEGQGMGQRKATRFEIPLCGDCRKRATAKSEEAQGAQLQAHLISAIVGMILVVGALALDLIDPRNLSIVDLFLGLILLIVGYGGPAYFLLNRVGDYLPPVDARYVRTTLLIPSETQGLETAFEWRHPEYARRFHDANSANVLGDVSGVKDRLA